MPYFPYLLKKVNNETSTTPDEILCKHSFLKQILNGCTNK